MIYALSKRYDLPDNIGMRNDIIKKRLSQETILKQITPAKMYCSKGKIVILNF